MAPSRQKKNTNLNAWPQAREVFHRPQRASYVKQQALSTNKECVFCQALLKGVNAKSLLVFKSALSMVVLNKYPYNTGHLLVLPQRHVAQLEKLAPKEFADLSLVLKLSVAVLKQAYNCKSLNVGLNLGREAGAGLPWHLHWHVIPRWLGDTNFFPLVADTKLVSESLGQSYKKIKHGFKSAT